MSDVSVVNRRRIDGREWSSKEDVVRAKGSLLVEVG